MNRFLVSGFLGIVTIIGLLSGCTQAGSERPVEQPIAKQVFICKAADFSDFIGQTEAMLAASTFQRGVIIRTIKPGQPVTMDYSDARANFVLDRNGVITEIKCG